MQGAELDREGVVYVHTYHVSGGGSIMCSHEPNAAEPGFAEIRTRIGGDGEYDHSVMASPYWGAVALPAAFAGILERAYADTYSGDANRVMLAHYRPHVT
jgi:hypothetical protein